MSIVYRKAASGICLLGLALSASTRLLAADADEPSASGTLEEITVTAERRAENLQTVPIAVDVITGEDALARGVSNIDTLFNTVPNLTFTLAGNATDIYLRGVGDASASYNNESSVAVYVDGVYNPNPEALTSFDFNNIERIEVLEGPQGTLFGRNATAGVIQIITPDPKQELSGKIAAGYGNYDTYSANAYLTGGITDTLSADVSVLWIDQIDGFGHDVTTGTPTLYQKDYAVRSKWLFEPSSTTKIHFVVDYSDAHDGGEAAEFVPVSAGLGTHGPYIGPYNISGPEPWLFHDTSYGAALTVDQDIGSTVHFQSISSYREQFGNSDINGTLAYTCKECIFDQSTAGYWTQEFHVSNLNPGRLTWMLGAFYYGNQVWGSNPEAQYGTALVGGYKGIYGDSNLASGSVFGQATVELIDQTKLTLGARYSDETIKAFSRTQNLAGAITAGPYDQEIRADPLTWRVVLDHQFTSDVMAYASYNKGYKSGGFNLSSPGSAPFYGEHLDDYELGLKSEFLDHRIRLNVDGFYYHYTDLQVALVLGGAQFFENAASAQNYGFDGSLDFVATQYLTFSSGLGLLSAKFLDYPGARGYTPAGVAINIPNASGADLNFAPPVTGFLGATYRQPTPIGKFTTSVNWAYNDKSYVTPDNNFERPAYSTLSATLEWQSLATHPWAIRLWGKNLTDATYYTFAAESGTGWYAQDGAPRQYGITVEKSF